MTTATMSTAATERPIAARAVAATKTYGHGDSTVQALVSVDVAFERGRFTAIMGPSGSGKSTLMHCMAGLDTLSSGDVFIGDNSLSKLSEHELTLLRRDQLGFIFQSFNLIPTLTAQENIELPQRLARRRTEPGWLDSRTGDEILEFMRRAVDELDQTVVMVTHDPRAAAHAHRVVFLADGGVVDEMADPTADRVLDIMKAFGR